MPCRQIRAFSLLFLAIQTTFAFKFCRFGAQEYAMMSDHSTRDLSINFNLPGKRHFIFDNNFNKMEKATL